jgi:hypothetical protein
MKEQAIKGRHEEMQRISCKATVFLLGNYNLYLVGQKSSHVKISRLEVEGTTVFRNVRKC